MPRPSPVAADGGGRRPLAANLLAAATSVPLLIGCAGMSDSQQRALTGTAGGAAGGALIGAIAGNAGMGAAIGAGTGLAGGLLYDYHKRSEQRAYQAGQQSVR